MKLIVTQDHINNGIPKDASACPIAQALAEKGFAHVEVEPSFIDIVDADMWIVYPTPNTARIFIEKFDNGEEVKPFEFELENGQEYDLEEWIDCRGN